MKKSPLKRSRTTLNNNSTWKSNSSPLKAGKSLSKGKSKLKSRPVSEEARNQQKEDIERMWVLFEQHWQSKVHICESCSIPIWGENKSLYHDHLLEKGIKKYEHLKYNIDNLFLCCWECHSNKGNGYPSENHKKAIKKAKNLFDIM